jgi:hypothetical protein
MTMLFALPVRIPGYARISHDTQPRSGWSCGTRCSGLIAERVQLLLIFSACASSYQVALANAERVCWYAGTLLGARRREKYGIIRYALETVNRGP